MIKLILLGESWGGKLERFFSINLARRYCVTTVSGSSLSETGNGDPLLLLETPRLARCVCSDTLVICQPEGRMRRRVPPGVPVIVSSDDTEQLNLLSKLKIPVFTCGLSSKDTFTFSSKSEESAVVSLMRRVTTLYGHSLDPLELPITFPSGMEDFPLLSYTASLLLCEICTPQDSAGQTNYFQL